jgi:hypothetical protein
VGTPARCALPPPHAALDETVGDPRGVAPAMFCVGAANVGALWSDARLVRIDRSTH